MALLYDCTAARLAFLCCNAHHTGQVTAVETAASKTKDTFKMSMLTHGLERPFNWAERPARISKARKVQLKRAALGALAVLSMGSLLAAAIALKTAIYVWHFHA